MMDRKSARRLTLNLCVTLCLIPAAYCGAADPEEEDVTAETISPDRFQYHVPDPELYRPTAMAALERARQENDQTTVALIERILERVDTIRRPRQVHLTLEDALRRTLEHSYAIEVQRYNPAIETTRVVEAESQFDAVFFTNVNKANIDQPSASQLTSADIDQFTSTYGIRKTLPSGMQISTSVGLDRSNIALAFQQINPAYTSTFETAMRQPLLRGFGIDFNRSTILITKNNRSISDWAFRRQVRDTLRTVDELYWRLVEARRDVTITARLLTQYEQIYTYLDARKDFDVIPVQLNATKANLEQARTGFIGRRANVFDAEDRLLAAINDPQLPLGGGVEIIPEDLPQISRIVIDPLVEAQTALDHRPEIKEQELTIANARIVVGRAKNLELPRLDMTFRYTLDGLSGTADSAFDQMTGGNFISYFVGVEFEVPIGNRGPRAAHRRAQLEHGQAEAVLRSLFEEIILDVHVTARELNTSYDQIWPSFESAEAREREVDSIVARAERKDLNTLINELNARQSLANDRRAMLNALARYNIAIVDLERAKGTLLRYDNVVITGEVD